MTRALVAACLVLAGARPTMAQDAGPSLRPHRFTVAAGVALLGGYDIGSVSATLRRSQPGTTTPGPLTLFAADGAIERAPSVEARVGFTVSPTIAIEFGGSYSRPTVAVDITSDDEAGDSPRLTDQRLSQYVVDVSALWQISQLKLGRRARPYLTAGGGYLRQLDVDRVRAQTGKIFHAGAGIRYWLRGGDARGRALGLRGEARMNARGGGVDFEEKTRVWPAVNLFLFFGF
jgi:hypothetical protein